MKFPSLCVFLAIGGLVAIDPTAGAQSVVGLSNFPIAGSAYSSLPTTFEGGAYTVTGLRFTTGADVTELNSATVPLFNITGNLNIASIYAEVWTAGGADGAEGSALFASTATTTAGGNIFQFSFAADTLAAGTQYWILYRSTTAPGIDNLQQQYLVGGSVTPTSAQSFAAFSSDLGWVVDGAASGASDGSPPLPSNGKVNLWNIAATPVPEPSTALAASAAGMLLLARRKRSEPT